MGESTDSDLIASITPDVMESLRRSQYFEKLDSLLCPDEGSGSPPKQCSGDYKFSEHILRGVGYDSEALQDIFEVLRSRGGCCDCEVLYNVAETSRLKANYWRSSQSESPVFSMSAIAMLRQLHQGDSASDGPPHDDCGLESRR